MNDEVWMRSHIHSGGFYVDETDDVAGRGPVVVRQETNDDDDDGIPDAETAVWYLRFETVEQAIKTVGVDRIGFYGQPVEVFLDGVRLTRERLEEIDRANAAARDPERMRREAESVRRARRAPGFDPRLP